jgi:hypothetical protein
MSRFRVTMSFDLEIPDERAAVVREITKELLTDQALSAIAAGGYLEGDSEAVLDDPGAIANCLSISGLDRGLNELIGSSPSNVQISNDTL